MSKRVPNPQPPAYGPELPEKPKQMPTMQKQHTDYRLRPEGEVLPHSDAFAAMAIYETRYNIGTSVHTSLATLIDEQLPLVHDRASVPAIARQSVSTFLGEHLGLNALIETEEATGRECVTAQRIAAIDMLQKFTDTPYIADISQEFADRLHVALGDHQAEVLIARYPEQSSDNSTAESA